MGRVLENIEVTTSNHNWWQAYGMECDPFSAPAHQNFFYIPRAWEQHINLLQLLARHSNELLLVQGARGAGKTAILEEFIEQLDETGPICRLSGQSASGTDQLIDLMVSAFDLSHDVEFGASPRVQMNHLLNVLIARGERCILIVDDAHRLSAPVMQAILHLQRRRWETQAPLAIVLSSELGFDERLHQLSEASLDPEMVKILHLISFEKEETQAYVLQRLQGAGVQELLFDPEEIGHIHQWSGGIPSRINNVARQLLLERLANPQKKDYSWRNEQRSNPSQLRLLWSGLFVCAAIVAGVLWQKSGIDSDDVQPLRFTQVTQEEMAKSQLVAQQEMDQYRERLKNQPEKFSVAKVTPAAPIENYQTAQKVQDLPKAEAVQNEQKIPPVQEASMPSSTDLTQNVTPEATSQGLHLAQQQIESLNSPKLTTPSESEKESEKEVVKEPEPVAKPAVPAHEKIAPPVTSKNQKHGKAENFKKPFSSSNQYTLQILGVSKLEEMQTYLRHEHLGPAAHFYRTAHQGKDWYVLLFGEFKSQKEAQAAIAHLPKDVRERHPWVRTLASLKPNLKK